MKNLSFVGLIALLFLMVCCQDSKIDYVSDAVQFLKDGDLAKAKELIDVASESEAISDSAHTWYYKGYIYYELYKNNKIVDGPERSLAMDYFKKSLDIDDRSKYAENSRTQMSNIAITFYNDAVNYISSKDPEKARNSFNIFLHVAVICSPNKNLDPKKIDVFNALGGLYTKLYEVNRRANRTYWILAMEYYNKVLAIDSLDVNANYNIGILYYNVAVFIINGTEYDIDLVALDDIQDTSLVLFKQSLPYMRYATSLDPYSEDILQGLKGIYFALNDPERLKEINIRLEALKMKKE